MDVDVGSNSIVDVDGVARFLQSIRQFVDVDIDGCFDNLLCGY